MPTMSSTPEMTTTPPPLPAQKSSENKSPLKLVMMLVIIVVVALASSGVTYILTNNARHKSEATLNKQIASLQSTDYPLPAGAVKVSECVPSMGMHYKLKNSDPLYGPFVLVSKKGKVLGMEYMAAPNMYTNIPNTDPPVSLIEKYSPLFGWKFDHAEFSHLPKGHQGLPIDHIDVHLYTVSFQEEANACK